MLGKAAPDDATLYAILSGSIPEIDVTAFAGCISLSEIVIPDSVNAIQHDAFSGCTNLKRITIPASIETIGETILANCSAELVVYGYAGSRAESYVKENSLAFIAIDGSESVEF